MATSIRWFALGLGLAFGGTAGALATASPGDLIYQAGGAAHCISAQQAACYAQCAIADGTWTGAVADMLRAGAQRDAACSPAFSAYVVGLKSAPANELPVGGAPVQVVGIAE